MINIKTAFKALQTIPRLSKEEWMNLDIVSKWLIATRSAVFIMTAISVSIGALLAFRDGSFSWILFIATFFGLLFAHASNNLINDYVDYKKGIDKDNYYRSQYGPQPLEHGLMSEKELFKYIAFSLGVAILLGIFIIAQTGMISLVLGLAGLFFVLFYTWPLKYIGLGEPSVLLIWGPLMIGGTYYVLTGNWSNEIALFSLVYAIGPTSVLFGKHTDKLIEDKKKKVYTLPVILGEKNSRFTNIGLWIIQYILVIGLVITQIVSPAMLLVLLALPKLIKTIKIYAKPRPIEKPIELPEGVWPLYLSAYAFLYNKTFGSLFLLGLLIDVLLTTVIA
jgi:1,4-dihydroxy-2-naphthoate polyprenyltransferase